MLGMLINAVYNLVDTYFIGGFGMIQTAAISLIFPLTLLATGFGTLFGNGAGSKIARLLGAKDREGASVYTSTALASAVICGVVLSTLLFVGLRPILSMLGADHDTLPFALQYGRIIIAGFLFSIFNITANNLIVSEGATVFSSIALSVGAVLNMILDPAFIFLFHMGIEGVAYATVLSSAVSTALYIVYFVNKSGKRLLQVSIKRVKFTGAIYREICKIGIPLLVFQVLNMAMLSVTNLLAVRYGNASVAAFGITYKLFCLETNAVFGFFKGYQPLIGYHFGAGNHSRVVQFTKSAAIITTGFCVICNVLLILFAPNAVYLFNQDSVEVLQFGAYVLRIQAVGYMTLGFQFLGAAYFLAIGKAKEGGVLSMARGIYFLILSCLLNALFGRAGLLLAFPLTEAVSSTTTAALLLRDTATGRMIPGKHTV